MNKADLMAMVDVLDELDRNADGLSIEDAVEIRDALLLVAAALKRSTSMVETQAKQQLEKPRTIGNKRYKKVTTYTKRWSHYKLATMIVDRVKVDRETGEIATVESAVAKALNIFIKLYCSDSTSVKVGALRRLVGVTDPMDEGLVREEATGTAIQVVELGDACSDDR